MSGRSRIGRVLGVIAITVGALALGLGVAALVGGLNEGGFAGLGVSLGYATLFVVPGVTLLLLGLRVTRKAPRPSNGPTTSPS